MIFDLLIPPRAPGGGSKNNFAVAGPIHVSNSHTKFGWISSNGLGGDSITDGCADRRTEAIAFLKKSFRIVLKCLLLKCYDLICFGTIELHCLW